MHRNQCTKTNLRKCKWSWTISRSFIYSYRTPLTTSSGRTLSRGWARPEGVLPIALDRKSAIAATSWNRRSKVCRRLASIWKLTAPESMKMMKSPKIVILPATSKTPSEERGSTNLLEDFTRRARGSWRLELIWPKIRKRWSSLVARLSLQLTSLLRSRDSIGRAGLLRRMIRRQHRNSLKSSRSVHKRLMRRRFRKSVLRSQ